MKHGSPQRLARSIYVCRRACFYVGAARRSRQSRSSTARQAWIANPTLNDAATTGGILLSAASLIYALHFLSSRSFVDRKDTRKLVHILCGPIFICFWPLYSATSSAALFATLVPFAAGLALFLTGNGLLNMQAMTTVSRGGDRKELLRGPFVYCVVLVVITAMRWQVTLPGICALSMMCGGDGFADIIGRRFGKNKLPWNDVKTAEGSFAMFLFGASLSEGLVAYFNAQGLMAVTALKAFPVIVLTSFVCTGIESIPATYVDDNISVPIAAGIVAYMLWNMPVFGIVPYS